MSTLYHILGLSQDASREQVKAAFRALARRLHPDVNMRNDAAEQRFKEVSQAYVTLADPDARAAYDRALVCRAAETQRQRRTFAATAASTFALTTTIGLALWWTQVTREPEQARASVRIAMGRGPLIGAQEVKQAPAETNGLTAPAAPPEGRGRGSGWATYNNVRYSFTLKYPGDVFAYDIGPSEGNVRIFGSRDGRAKLHIFATDNGAGTTLAQYRRSRMGEHYAGAVFDSISQRKFGLVLSGTQGDKAFYERVTFACNGRAIYGWQMVFPVSQRTLYDLIADAVDRSFTHSSRCRERRQGQRE